MDKPDTTSGRREAPGQEKVIERAKQELEQMIDLAPQVMLLVSRRGTVLRANRAMLAFGGFSGFGQVLGRTLDGVFACASPGFFDTMLAGGCEGEVRSAGVTRPDGQRREMAFTLIGPGGGSDVLVLMASDVTDEVAERADLEKKHKIEAASVLVGALMHHINQPLTVIAVTVKLMLMSLEKGSVQPDEMKRQLESIMDLTLQVAALLKQAGDPKDFVTESYPGNREILDIERSGRGV